jgi:DNA mismatch repair protein MutL
VVSAIRRALAGPHETSVKAFPETAGELVLRAEEPKAPYSGLYSAPPLPRKSTVVASLQPDLIQEGLFRQGPGISYSDKGIVGVFQSTYILLEDESSLYILDQHAAHERVTYEKLKNAPSSSRSPSQDLVSPLVVELSAMEFSAFEEIADEISSIGIDAAVFGQGAVAVRSVPAPLLKSDIRGIILDLLGAVAEGDLRRKELHDDMLARIACHRSVRAGKRLQAAEIAGLLKDLDEVGSPLTCPHGRPLFKKIGRDEIERWIGRRP